MSIVNVNQILVLIIALVAIILVFKFMKGCIKAVVCLFILIIGIMLFVKLGGVEGVTDTVNDYIESSFSSLANE